MREITPVVKQLLIINILFFIGFYFVPFAMDVFSLHFFMNQSFRFWQPLTYMFVNVSVLQIFFSLFALYSFGSMLESILGKNKFLFFYLSCGIGAALLYNAISYYYFHQGVSILTSHGYSEIDVLRIMKEGKYDLNWEDFMSKSEFNYFIKAYNLPAFGSAGALYGLLTAFAFMFPNVELMFLFFPVPIKAKYYISLILLSDIFSGVTGFSIFGGNIEHYSSIGGALIGFLMMWYWKKNSFNDRRWN